MAIGGKFIIRAHMELNGQDMADFDSVSESEVVINKTVPLMYGTGTAQKTKRWEISVDYKTPAVGEIDWFNNIANATVVLDYENGERHEYGGVQVISVGEAKTDGETEQKRTIKLFAASRDGIYG
jgi:hypothetical protein